MLANHARFKGMVGGRELEGMRCWFSFRPGNRAGPMRTLEQMKMEPVYTGDTKLRVRFGAGDSGSVS